MKAFKIGENKKIKDLVIIAILSITIIFLAFFTYHSYMKKQTIQFDSVEVLDMKTLIQKSPLTIGEEGISLEVTNQDLDNLIFTYIKNLSKENAKLKSIQSVHYDLDKKVLELSVGEEQAYNYTFAIKSDLDVVEDTLNLSLGACRLGSLKVPVPKWYFQNATGLKMELALPVVDEKELMALSKVQKTDDKMMLNFKYNDDFLMKTFEGYIPYIDDSRVLLHDKKQDINELYIKIGQTKKISLESAKNCITLFGKDPQNIKDFSFILNKEGQKKVYDELSYLFTKNISLEEWYALSEQDIETGLAQYHNQLIEGFYKYLYQNKAYTLSSDSVRIYDAPIHYEDVLGAVGEHELIYDVEIVTEGNLVYAQYNVNGNEVKKLLFTRR